MLKRLFTAHPAAVGETYWQHFAVAAGFGWRLLQASAACFVHAVVPGLCTTTGSRAVRTLHTRMVTHRAPPATSAEAAALWIAADI
jgi:hypothetical protein